MRVALVDPSLFTWPYDSALALSLEQVGHDVRIFGKPLDPAHAGRAHRLLAAHFYRGLAPSTSGGLARAVFLARKGVSHAFAMRSLIGELRRFRPDVIHFQWAPLPIVDRLFIAQLRAIAPVVLTVHDSTPFNGNPRSFIQGMGAVSIMARFDRLIVHTKQAAARLERYGVSTALVRCVPHGPLDDVQPATPSHAHVEACRAREAALADGAPVKVLLFGRLKHYKGADVLLRAVALLPPGVRARCLVEIVGEPFIDLGPLAQIVREGGLAACVKIDPRFVGEDEVRDILSSADVLVFPYREIDASGVLMKSLASGAPIIASRIGLFSELLVDGKHGRLVPPEDVAELAQALEQLVMDDALRARMGAAVRRLRDELPSWSAIAQTTTEIYEELARSAKQRAALGV